MNNIYDFTFLTSPVNPRFDNWIGQSFILSYLNSESGSNFLFTYKPYENISSLVNKEDQFATLNNNNNSNIDFLTYSTRTNQEGIITDNSALEEKINKEIELLTNHSFDASLEEANAIILSIHTIVDILKTSTIERIPIMAKRIDEIVDALIHENRLFGHRPNQIKEIITLFYELGYFNQAREAKDFFDIIAENRFIPRESIQMAHYLLGQSDRIRNALTLDEIFPELKSLKTLYNTSIHYSIISDLSSLDSIIRKPYQTANDEDTIANTYRSFTRYGDNVVEEGYLDKGLFNSNRETSTGHLWGTYINTSKRDAIGFLFTDEILATSISREHGTNDAYLQMPIYNATKETNYGYLYRLKINIDKEDMVSYQLQTSNIADRSIDKDAYEISDDIFSQSHSRESYQEIKNLTYIDRHVADANIHIHNHFFDFDGRSSLITYEDSFITKDISRNVYTESLQVTFVDRHEANSIIMQERSFIELMSKDFKHIDVITNTIYADVSNTKHAGITNKKIYSNTNAENVFIMDPTIRVTKSPDNAFLYKPTIIGPEEEVKNSFNAYIVREDIKVDKTNKNARYDQHYFLIEDMQLNSNYYTDANVEVVKLENNMIVDDNRFVFTDRMGKDSDLIVEQLLGVNTIRDLKFDTIVNYGAPSMLDAHIMEQLNNRSVKIRLDAFISHILRSFTRTEKAMIIKGKWEVLKKVSKHFLNVDEFVEKRLAEIKEHRIQNFDAYVNNTKIATDKQYKDSDFYTSILAEYDHLDALILELMGGAQRVEYLEGVIKEYIDADGENLDREGYIKKESLATNITKENLIAIIEKTIIAHDEMKYSRDAYIPQSYILVQDPSDWEDIWNKYHGGVDVLDVPNLDYDYSELASNVYDLATGVPYDPLSPLNVSDVKVRTPLHHPLPANFDLGTEEVIVDTYIMIDVMLALNTIMNNDKIKYAGMPAEMATRELFSKLFTWIQQAAPGNKEYDRMYRFARWYGETIVLQLSNHILHREYKSWKSTLHIGEDLGVPYTTSTWVYNLPYGVLQTNSTHAELVFNKESYIDSTATIRGYMDNPDGLGVLKIYTNGVLLKEISVNGSFTETFDILYGINEYRLIFDGSSGQVSLSSLEIGGCVFVNAYTTSDDSNTNGLKAMTTLLKMLTTYYDIHHGDGKIKGSMAVKQRKLIHTE